MKKDYLSKLFTLLALVGMPFALTYGQLEVTAPANVAGTYNSGYSLFGPLAGGLAGEVVVVTDSAGLTTACVGIDNGVTDVTGKIALIDRGACAFTQKALNAEAAGAIGVLICNNDMANPDAIINTAGDDGCALTIPVVSLSYNDCQTLRVETGVMVSLNGGITYTIENPVAIVDGHWDSDPIIGGDGLFSGGGAVFVTYVAAANGILNVSSCGYGTDTHLIIAQTSGACRTELWANLEVIDESIDDCDDGGGNIVASETNTPVYAGQTYYIIWDDAQSADAFSFDVSLEPLTPVDYTFNVNMAFETVSADGIQMVYAGPGATGLGDVTLVAMDDSDGDGIYSATVTLTVLDTIGYAFVNGDVLMGGAVETVPAECGIDGGFGFNVRPLIATSIDPVTIDPVCFSGCSNCEVTDCEDPFIIIDDDIEALAEGNANGQTTWWGTWPGGGSSGVVTTEQAQSGTKSIKIAGSISGQDCLLQFGDRTQGHYMIRWDMFVPAGSNGYFNLQHLAPTSSAGFWGLECYFEDGVGRLELYDGSDPVAFNFPSGAWFPVYLFVDIDNDEARLNVAEYFVDAWQFSTGASAAAMVNQLNSLNFYPADASYQFYLDNIDFQQIPAAGAGQYCYTATPITPGPQTVTGLSCFGGFHDLRFSTSTGTNADAGAWFSYTPEEDGIMSISSCGGDADTRGWIFEGDCHSLILRGVNDDRCMQSNGDDYASYKEARVEAGKTYYILWDDVWDRTDFAWELAFTSDAPAELAFCETAVPVEPGEVILDGFVGEAAYAGMAVGSTSGGYPTCYSGSNWYSYTPEADGTVTITSCDAGTDTRVYVYTGTCDNFTTLTVVASSDDDCGASSLIEGLEVTAGTTYYIEWLDAYSADPFIWELIYMEPVVTVTFNVDMAKVAEWGSVSPDGVHIAGSFQGWDPAATLMTDNGDGTWSYTTTMAPGTEVQYKYLNGNAWGTDEVNITADCGVDGGSGSYNRALTVGADDVSTPFYCFDFCVTCDLVATDEEALQAGVKVFPNPVKALLNVSVDLPEAAENLNIRMANAFGQVVYERYFGRLQNDNIEIDVANLPAGAYMIQVSDGKAQYTQSVVVQK
ncbi:MAG: T9SS type A sorting domain-containing protein [Phaeodactylibacter sp.]|nr:T9SS type A sorting domain-containing protein [Phaeodactylibacter sp.]MCB9276371.1 T9SS type A sorting domain-containing protein [Lewinellaceae bacterium]